MQKNTTTLRTCAHTHLVVRAHDLHPGAIFVVLVEELGMDVGVVRLEVLGDRTGALDDVKSSEKRPALSRGEFFQRSHNATQQCQPEHRKCTHLLFPSALISHSFIASWSFCSSSADSFEACGDASLSRKTNLISFGVQRKTWIENTFNNEI